MKCEHCGIALNKDSLLELGLKYGCPTCGRVLTRKTFTGGDPCRLGPNVRVVD